MDKIYNQKKVEDKWYKFWEESGLFKPEINPDGDPYIIILPPPNANADLHFGHAVMSVEDILIRYYRMRGFSALWLPGSDHAGFETQVVYEKHLDKQGKSRFDFDRETLYKDIMSFVLENKSKMENQLRRLGFSVDWSREKFTLDQDVIKLVYQTFKKLYDDGLVYRDVRLVNYCTKHGTGFSDLEIVYEERKTPFYYMKYGPFTIATARPETKFRDTALAVNPNDPRYKDKIGKKFKIQGLLGEVEMTIIPDPEVDPEFGTGIMKVTPAHDPHDFDLGKHHNLPVTPIIDFQGRMDFSWYLENPENKDQKYLDRAKKYHGQKVATARQMMVEDLQADDLIEKIDENYTHRIGTCYKCSTPLEPLPMEQWFIDVKPLAKKAIDVVKQKKLQIYPKNFETIYLHWMENIRDWNISRQIVWGIRIPAWKCLDCGDWTVTEGQTPNKCHKCSSSKLEQDSDTFDTWFSSGQWPVVTLKTTRDGDFEKFYPTSVMETGRDILFYWVARMVMLGIYITGEIPFKDVVIHGLVLDPHGKKMSKSKGNVVSPMEIIDAYGADAARMALVYGTATGHDQALSYPKLDAMRKFTNKLWNIGRFIIDFNPDKEKPNTHEVIAQQEARQRVITIRQLAEKQSSHKEDQFILQKLQETSKKVSFALDQYRFHDGAEILYEFIWHEFADKYIESVKDRRSEAQPILEYVFKTSLELLHPYMPFITEELWQRLPHEEKSIMIAKWPKV